jgi:hypothetical protein
LPSHLFVDRHHKSIIVGNFRVAISRPLAANPDRLRRQWSLLMWPGKQNCGGQDRCRCRRPGTRRLPTAKQR